MIRGTLQPVRATVDYLQLPAAAKAERRKDSSGLPAHDPGIERAIDEGVAWLGRAQDHSTSADGGVARHYSLVTGWSTSYPETTGYIIPTMLSYARLRGDETARHRAQRMLDWLTSIQFPDGSFQGSSIGARRVVPVTFNTGQILLGLASGVRAFGQYREAMCRTADWLVTTQDPDGCWRKHPTPFAAPGEKTYETHVAWGLLEAARLVPDKPYADAALANVHWALRWQRENGWFEKCCLTDPSQPLTHTLGYALRGIIEAYRFSHDEAMLKAARRAADGLLTAVKEDGFLPGRLRPDWRGAVSWACLTGSAQIACCWLMLYQDTGEVVYRDAAFAANGYLRRTMQVDGPPETRGAIKGPFPVHGRYGTYQYLNWACKFFVDANMIEQAIREQMGERNGNCGR
jgi:Squalene-hopene cyclase C-terminal domain